MRTYGVFCDQIVVTIATLVGKGANLQIPNTPSVVQTLRDYHCL